MHTIETLFTAKERARAQQLREWAAVLEHRAAVRASVELQGFISSRVDLQGEEDLLLLSDPEAYGYVHRMRSSLAGINGFRGGDHEADVRLRVLAYLAAREELGGTPAYTVAERAYARVLSTWEVVKELSGRFCRTRPVGEPWTPEEEGVYAAALLDLWAEARDWMRAYVPADVHLDLPRAP